MTKIIIRRLEWLRVELPGPDPVIPWNGTALPPPAFPSIRNNYAVKLGTPGMTRV
ncbi:hypothetical protein GCM10022241_18130 [Micrococcus endophyticus]